MARMTLMASRDVGAGGAVGWLEPGTVDFLDDGSPTIATAVLRYKIAQLDGDAAISFTWDSASTALAIRSQVKQAVRASILAVYGIDIPVTRIKVLNVPE